MAFDGVSQPHVTEPNIDGSVTLHWADNSLDVRFTWAVLASLQAAWGDDFLAAASEALDRKDVSRICEMLSFATGWEQRDLMDLSPPIVPAVTALTVAWQSAWMGGKVQIPEDEDEAETEPEKLIGPPTLWGRLSKMLSGLVSRGSNSGA